MRCKNKIRNTLADAMTTILNLDLQEPRALQQAFLPVSLGGLGVRKASDLSLLAFISSAASCKSLVSDILLNFPSNSTQDNMLTAAIASWSTKAGRLPPSSTLQKDWDLPLANQSYDAMLLSACS